MGSKKPTPTPTRGDDEVGESLGSLALSTRGGDEAGETWAVGETLGSPLASTSDESASLPPIALSGESDTPSLELGAALGRGGVGIVLDGVQLGLDRPVAVKCPRDDRDDARAAAILVREARVAGSLEHPNILPVHALGRDASGRPIVVMPRIDGASWRELINRDDHPLWQAFDGDRLERNLRVLMTLCRAVHFAHGRGILHRDLKPDNVMIGELGQVYLVDWGLAARLDNDPHTTGIVGTPGYMAPEMFEIGARVDARTDVYQLGAILHEILTGQRRHVGPDLRDVAASTCQSDAIDYADDVPAPLAQVASRACAARPVDRHPDANELRRAVADFLLHREALAVTVRAEAELDRLIAEESEDAREAQFGACRFGFREALRIWPDNARAATGLGRAVGIVIERELARGAPDAARRLLVELPAPRPDLEAAVEAALTRARGDRDRLVALEAWAHDRDPKQGDRWRLALQTAVVTLFVAGPIATGLARRRGWLPLEPSPLVRAALPVALGLVVLLWIRVRAHAFPDGYNRRLVMALGGTLFAIGAHWAATMVTGVPFATALAYIPPILSAMSSGLAVGLDRRFWGAALIYLLGVPVVALAARDGHGEIALGVLNGVVVGDLVRRYRRLS